MNYKYRIFRTDPNNLTIQCKSEKAKNWRVISYHGNSLKSLISGLLDVIGTEYQPVDKPLLEQLKLLESVLDESVSELSKMI